MRLISQDGRVSVNYDNVALVVQKTNDSRWEIVAKDISGLQYCMGTYSNEELAAEMLMDAYFFNSGKIYFFKNEGDPPRMS